MRPSLPITLTALLTISACSTITESRFNPVNWFGASEQVEQAPETPRLTFAPLVRPGQLETIIDNRPLISEITELRVDQIPTGALISATGIAATHGFFNAELIRNSLEDGVLTLDFRAEAPAGAQTSENTASRQITAALRIDTADLIGVRSITVNGASNSRRVSR